MSEAWFPNDVTVAEALKGASERLRQAGIENPKRDARILLAAAAGLTALDLIKDPVRKLGRSDKSTAGAFLERRLAREPVSRILGQREFYGHPFLVTPATLDPRPETETLISAVLEISDLEGWRNRPVRFLDVGTGTGCIGLTLLKELPTAQAVLSDLSREALEVARRNAVRLEVAERISLVTARSLTGIEGPFDFIVSNPPYIASADVKRLQLEVKGFDPILALDGGDDGLAIYREIASGLTRIIPKGWVFFEVGAGQAKDVARILSDAGLIASRVWKDLGGHERCVAALTHF
jgi:release factor glutamine methyltransferase